MRQRETDQAFGETPESAGRSTKARDEGAAGRLLDLQRLTGNAAVVSALRSGRLADMGVPAGSALSVQRMAGGEEEEEEDDSSE